MDTGRITAALGGLGVLALMVIFLPRPVSATIIALVGVLIVIRYFVDIGELARLRQGSRGGPR